MKKSITILITVLVIIAGFWLYQRSKIQPQVKTTDQPKTSVAPTLSPKQSISGQLFEIVITENGSSQNNLIIKAGDTIKFINNDTALHWPAAGTHPTHNLCPGFDSLKGLKQGESFSFTFNEAGVCPFHDHLNARDSRFNGTIEISGGK